MTAHIKHPTPAGSTLHVNYPYGIIILQNLYPSLLRHAEKINISGWYDGTHSSQQHPSRTAQHSIVDCLPELAYQPPRNAGPTLPEISKQTHDAANSALTRLMRTCMSPTGHPTVKSINFRIFYPDEGRYSVVWGCDDSPIVVGLRNTCGGTFDMKVWRGRCGNGVVMSVVPNSHARVVSTVWRKFKGAAAREKEAWRGFGVEKVWSESVPEEESWIVN